MENTIRINDLLNLSDEEMANVKIKFNQDNGEEDPMEVYVHDPNLINNQWLFWRNKQRYFEVNQIAVCFLKLSYDTWLLTTIKRVTKELGVFEGINYEGEEIKKFKKFFGRVVIKYHKKTQGQGYYAKTIIDDLEVLEVLPSLFDGERFKGYDQVSLSYRQLESIINRRKQDWVAALSNQKGVYLITDTSNGKLYIGSAYGSNGMLLDRWAQYIKTGHGWNKDLQTLIKNNGIQYAIDNFRFSIIENYNSKVDSSLVIEREQWWKNLLLTREFGYNKN